MAGRSAQNFLGVNSTSIRGSFRPTSGFSSHTISLISYIFWKFSHKNGNYSHTFGLKALIFLYSQSQFLN